MLKAETSSYISMWSGFSRFVTNTLESQTTTDDRQTTSYYYKLYRTDDRGETSSQVKETKKNPR